MLELQFPSSTHGSLYYDMKERRKKYQVSAQSKGLFKHEKYEDFLTEKQQDIM
jgi:hypothetical protein